jgi:hypothetical protein
MSTILADRELRDLIERIESDYDTVFDALESDAGVICYRGVLYLILDTLGEVATYLDRLRKDPALRRAVP